MFNLSKPIKIFVFVLILLLIVAGLISVSMSLFLGLAFSLFIGNPLAKNALKFSSVTLSASIVVLGLTLNIKEVIHTAQSSFLITATTIVFALVCGLLLGRLFKIEKKLSVLIAGGTAICGGSAIAALVPSIQAKSSDILVAVTVVFLLNALGLIIYPELGAYLGLDQQDFGLWAALGIHDTSSVIGAASHYGDESLKIATTTKLARSLWIIPLVFIAAYSFKGNKKAKFPKFILFFIAASVAASFIPLLEPIMPWALTVSKIGMAVSLFLIGSSFTRDNLKEVKAGALWQGLILWVLVSVFSFWMIKLL